MDTTRQMFQISKFPYTLSFFTIPRMFRRNLTEVSQIYIPDKPRLNWKNRKCAEKQDKELTYNLNWKITIRGDC